MRSYWASLGRYSCGTPNMRARNKCVTRLPLPLSLIPERFTLRPSLVLAPSVRHQYGDSPDGCLG